MGRISALTELTSLASNDYLIVLDSSANIAKKITVANAFGIPDLGWSASGETWTYSSWTSGTATAVVTVPSNATTKYTVGMFVRFAQSTGGTKYGRILAVTTTSLTLYLGSYTLNNEAITSPVYSPLATPLGLPTNVRVYNRYKFHGTRQAALNSSNGSFANILFDAEDFDNNSNFDITTNQGRYTAPVTGYYWFYARASAATSSQFLLALAKNGTTYNRGGHTLTGSGTVGVTYGCLVYLTAGDYVTMQNFGSGGAFEVGSGCYFGGYLVSEG